MMAFHQPAIFTDDVLIRDLAHAVAITSKQFSRADPLRFFRSRCGSKGNPNMYTVHV